MEPSPVISEFFSKEIQISSKFLDIIDELNNALEDFQLPREVQCVYNPTIYARRTFEMYVQNYCNTKKPIMYFGMNPGPWGMSQTGVPFGEVTSVRDWLRIEGPVEKPPNEISPRQVKGFECNRTEISGKRFWGLFKSICGRPENFFKTSFVYNYLPQQWMKSNGCNLTPGDFRILFSIIYNKCVCYTEIEINLLKIITFPTGSITAQSYRQKSKLFSSPLFYYIDNTVAQMQPLFQICDPVFIRVLELYDVRTVVAVGKFCENRAQKALDLYLPGNNIQILYLPHPSPRTVNNNNWDKKAIDCLKNLDILKYYNNPEGS